MCNNLNLDLVSINAYTKFGKILSSSKDIEQKRNYDGQNNRQPKSSIVIVSWRLDLNGPLFSVHRQKIEETTYDGHLKSWAKYMLLVLSRSISFRWTEWPPQQIFS